MKLIEGKITLSFHAYKLLATILFKSEKVEYIAAHEFLILEWNLMAIAENRVGAKIDHISFHQDTLLFDFEKTKTDQEGTKNVVACLRQLPLTRCLPCISSCTIHHIKSYNYKWQL